jgi:haloalkane dehalogenase
VLTGLDLPVLLPFSDGDPITAGLGPVLGASLPGAAGRVHPTIAGAGHFLQEDAGPALAAAILDFRPAPGATG